jgi:hypothetical protein
MCPHIMSLSCDLKASATEDYENELNKWRVFPPLLGSESTELFLFDFLLFVVWEGDSSLLRIQWK